MTPSPSVFVWRQHHGEDLGPQLGEPSREERPARVGEAGDNAAMRLERLIEALAELARLAVDDLDPLALDRVHR